MDKYSILAIIAQLLFGARMYSQWILSEKKKKSVTPLFFWWLSLSGSFLLFIYGYLRVDFALMLGQVLTYFIYIRNLQIQDQWKRIPRWSRLLFFLIPLTILTYGFSHDDYGIDTLLDNPDIEQWLLILGVIAQIVFTLRFVYQWIYAEENKEAVLPLGFWIISLLGGLMTLTYFVFRQDVVLIISNVMGAIIYTRNIMLYRKKV
ncbi:lipid-A-disaccharide synthase N-terminal domain-containing protein [Dokdonia sp.]|uniref:lipid-A-disaccharide synthase N-terminal domain-containing protein n=1 Tax=Dokdonia sp. TaxID=2024995 RepID=UPI003263EE75